MQSELKLYDSCDLSEIETLETLQELVSSNSEPREFEDQPLQESVYGACMAQVLWVSMHPDRPGSIMALALGFLHVLNLIVQVAISVYIMKYIVYPAKVNVRQLYDKFHDETFDMHGNFDLDVWDALAMEDKDAMCSIPLNCPIFLFIILAIWLLAMLPDIQDTWREIWWMYQLPGRDESAKGQVYSEGSQDVEVVVMVSRKLRWTLIICVLVPKAIVGVYVWNVGCRWLLATPNFQDIILNSVALGFVIQLDEMLYESVLPGVCKDFLNRIRIRTPGKSQKHLQLNLALRILSQTVALVVVPFFYMVFFQSVLPNFKFDMGDACQDLWHMQFKF